MRINEKLVITFIIFLGMIGLLFMNTRIAPLPTPEPINQPEENLFPIQPHPVKG